MPINLQTLRTRALTALIFVLVMFAGLFINGWLFCALFLVIMIGSLLEFFKMMRKIQPGRIALYFHFALFYIVFPILMMIDLGIDFQNSRKGLTYSAVIPSTILFSIWINDTSAYLVGSLIGKTPFSPISPRKTWEGTVGGALLCIAVMCLLWFYFPFDFSFKDILIIASLSAVFSILGDLLESKLKRMADIKDSGKIMPGHGGFLDRFDSLFIATPFVWAYVNWMM